MVWAIGNFLHFFENFFCLSFVTRTVTVEVPDIDVHNLIKGDWKVGHFDCLKNPPICELPHETDSCIKPRLQKKIF
jgi:hypothetical protein